MKLRLRLLIIAFIISFLFVTGFSFISITRFTKMADQNEQVDRSFKVMRQLGRLVRIVKDMDVHETGYLITRDPLHFSLFEGDKARADSVVAGLEPLITDNGEQKGRLSTLKAGLITRLDTGRKNMRLPDTMVHSLNGSLQVSADCLSLIDRMQKTEEEFMKSSTSRRDSDQQVTSSSVKYLSVLFGLLMLTLFLLLLQELRRRGRYQDQLQEKITELQRSHSELEQIAYAASHDLQEPLRKIRIFTDRLQHLHKDDLDEESLDTLDRIVQYANRMQELVSDLMNLTSLVNNDEAQRTLSLAEPVQKSLEALQEKIAEQGARVQVADLPVITGYPFQLFILFRSLLDNALKFTRPGIPPQVSISYAQVPAGELEGLAAQHSEEGYHCISVADNGIGFDNKFADKIFQIFQRLHGQEAGYSGKGIGLAICQRIMVNHKGVIMAYGHPASGATFKLYFPVKAVGN